MRKELELLIKLQEKDNALDVVKMKAGLIPVEIEKQNTLINSLKTTIEDKKGNLKKLQLSKKEKELEVETKDNEIKKHNMELNSIKANDAYKALLKEIETCKQIKNQLEDEILDIMESMEKEAVFVKEEEAKIKQQEAEMLSKAAALNKELEDYKKQISDLENDRIEFAKTIPMEILSNYDGIREGRQGIAVVPVEGENCGGCGMSLRPQLINDIHKGQEILTCDSCSRILFKKIETPK